MRQLRWACVALLCLGPYPGLGQAASRSKAAKPAWHAGSPVSGSLSNGVYRNPFFSITCKIPYGWVDRSSDLQAGNEPGKSWVLLAAFEHPPQATTENINSGVVIAAESLSVYPGLKFPVQYFHLLDEVTTGKGFKADGDPYEQVIGPHTLVRGDFAKPMGPATMHQASLALVSRGYALSFTFIGDSEDEVNDLVKGLSFTAAKPTR